MRMIKTNAYISEIPNSKNGKMLLRNENKLAQFVSI